jgi:hypothetical protein
MAKQRGTISKRAWDRADPGERAAMILGVLTGKRMDQDKFTKLLEVSDSQTQLKLRVLHNAIIQCMRDYQTDRSRAKLNDWKAAEKALEEFIDSLWKQHFQEDEEKPEEQPETLPNLLAVVDYLGKQGWSIKKSAVYKHQKEGKIRPGKDGRFRIQDVDAYAEKYLQRLDGSDPVLDSLQEKKLKADTQKAEAQARHWRLKTKIAEGLYIQRDEYERDLAARAAVFKLDIENFIRSQASEIIHIVEGDESKTGDLIEFMLDRAEGWLDRYTVKKSFKVVLPRDTDEDETD